MKAQSVFTLVSLRNGAYVFLTPVCAYEHTHVHPPLLPFLNLTVQLHLSLTARGICKSLIYFFKSLWPCGLDVINRKTAAASYSILKHKVYTRTASRHKTTGVEAYNGQDVGHWHKDWDPNLHRLCSVSLAVPLYSRHGLVGMSF